MIVRAWARLEIRLGLDDFLPGSARLELDVYERAQARARLGLEKIAREPLWAQRASKNSCNFNPQN